MIALLIMATVPWLLPDDPLIMQMNDDLRGAEAAGADIPFKPVLNCVGDKLAKYEVPEKEVGHVEFALKMGSILLENCKYSKAKADAEAALKKAAPEEQKSIIDRKLNRILAINDFVVKAALIAKFKIKFGEGAPSENIPSILIPTPNSAPTTIHSDE